MVVFQLNSEYVFLGAAGTAAVEVTENIEFPTSSELEVYIKIIIQVIIGVATLMSMIQRRKKVKLKTIKKN